MPFRLRSMAREIGAAVAVLALYMLVLLAPLHQAAGLQRDLADLGYASLDTWSICEPLANEPGEGEAVAKCAAVGIGKNEIVPVDVPRIVIGNIQLASVVDYPTRPLLIAPSVEQHPGNPRGPPAIV